MVPLLSGVEFSWVELHWVYTTPKDRSDDVSKVTPYLNRLIMGKMSGGDTSFPFPKV